MPPRRIAAPRCGQVRQCIHHTRVQRLSTSSPYKATRIPPESPKFIEIPRPIQLAQSYPVRVKGILPVPRRIIRRQDIDKTSPEYFANVTPNPLMDKASTTIYADSRTAEMVSYKARQAEARRRNLREGLIELSNRKQEQERRLLFRSRKRQAQRIVALEAPEREDERLTAPSVLQSELPLKHHVLPDPNREARLARKRQNVMKMQAMREENRRNALHTLYVNAGDFITTGAQLDSTIDKVFDDLRQFSSDSRPGANVWNLGFPETVKQLLARASQTSGKKALEAAEGNAGITRERMRKIAEELTGGKMADA
ncbi:hypothetical protein N7G274_007196 [Stereocaulon virgatum]|uniref:Uncharacterized protein n=1 Tax=Stereocaulon virgatum TaxID=373712 RepID=A0ABR4A5E5_9LECA